MKIKKRQNRVEEDRKDRFLMSFYLSSIKNNFKCFNLEFDPE